MNDLLSIEKSYCCDIYCIYNILGTNIVCTKKDPKSVMCNKNTITKDFANKQYENIFWKVFLQNHYFCLTFSLSN